MHAGYQKNSNKNKKKRREIDIVAAHYLSSLELSSKR